jgi:murein DD-endopeptidase MepM/ murein hydrolase activator NlpD
MKLLLLLATTILAASAAVTSVTTTTTTTTTSKPPTSPPANPAQAAQYISQLRAKHLVLPIDNFNVETIKGSFYQGRGTDRMHRAADFMASRGTPIRAVDDGKIARLFVSKNGGNTIYETDPSGEFVYYYAHLDSYAPGLANGQQVRKGQVIGFVGSTGDADGNAPHLHFQIWAPTTKSFWDGLTIDPYEVFKTGVK